MTDRVTPAGPEERGEGLREDVCPQCGRGRSEHIGDDEICPLPAATPSPDTGADPREGHGVSGLFHHEPGAPCVVCDRHTPDTGAEERLRAALHGHGGLVDRIRQRTAGAGFDLLVLREHGDNPEARAGAVERLTGHINEIDRICTAALHDSVSSGTGNVDEGETG